MLVLHGVLLLLLLPAWRRECRQPVAGGRGPAEPFLVLLALPLEGEQLLVVAALEPEDEVAQGVVCVVGKDAASLPDTARGGKDKRVSTLRSSQRADPART